MDTKQNLSSEEVEKSYPRAFLAVQTLFPAIKRELNMDENTKIIFYHYRDEEDVYLGVRFRDKLGDSGFWWDDDSEEWR